MLVLGVPGGFLKAQAASDEQESEVSLYELLLLRDEALVEEASMLAAAAIRPRHTGRCTPRPPVPEVPDPVAGSLDKEPEAPDPVFLAPAGHLWCPQNLNSRGRGEEGRRGVVETAAGGPFWTPQRAAATAS